MKKTIKINFSLLILVLVMNLSCKNKSNTDKKFNPPEPQDLHYGEFSQIKLLNKSITPINIPSSERFEDIIDMSEMIEESYMLPLETKKENIIGEIDDVIIFEDKILILDSRNAKTVALYSIDGKFIRTIGKVGKGPGEYLFPEDVAVNLMSKQIYVFNGTVRKIYRYDFEGNFLGDIQIGFGANAIEFSQDGTLLLLARGYDNDHLGELKNRIFYKTDLEGNILAYGPKRNETFNSLQISLLNKSLVKNSTNSYNQIFSDTIYEILGSTVNAKYAINFEKPIRQMEKYYDMKNNEFFNELKESEIPYFLGLHCQVPGRLYFRFSWKNLAIHCYYNNSNSELNIGSKITSYTENTYGGSWTPITSHQDYFISSVDPAELLELQEKFGTLDATESDKIQKLQKNISNMNLDLFDNPVLVFFKLK